jgi:hypothetical protein
MVGGGKGETNAYGRPVGVDRGGIAAEPSNRFRVCMEPRRCTLSQFLSADPGPPEPNPTSQSRAIVAFGARPPCEGTTRLKAQNRQPREPQNSRAGH